MNWKHLIKSSKLGACLLCILERNFQRMLRCPTDLRYPLNMLSVSTDSTDTIWGSPSWDGSLLGVPVSGGWTKLLYHQCWKKQKRAAGRGIGQRESEGFIEASHCQTWQYHPGLLTGNVWGVMPLWREWCMTTSHFIIQWSWDYIYLLIYVCY